MAKAPIGLGKIQLRIMQILWQRGEASARQITDDLNVHGAIAHSTVQTLLRQLEGKKLIDHSVKDRVFSFRPLIEQSEVAESAADDMLSRVFGGSALGLVAHLVKTKKITRQELDELKTLIDSHLETDEKP